MKAKSILFLTLFLLTINLFSQERVNKAKLTFNKVSGVLKGVTGYAYNSTFGEWIDYKNVICEDKIYKGEFKALQGGYMMSNFTQNFNSMQTKTVIVDSVTYYVLVIDKWGGYWEYPSLMQDWTEYKLTEGFIFSSDEFKKLENIDSSLNLTTQRKVSLGSKFDKYNEVDFLDLIRNEIGATRFSSSTTYTFPLIKSKEGKIRFNIPEYFNPKNRYDLANKYFETDLISFKNIIIK